MITVNCGYMEQPDVRNDLKELQRRGMLQVSADRWMIEVGEEDIIASADLPLLTRLRVIAFSWILRLSTPAHKYLELVYDAAVSKEFIPVMFSRHDIRVPLPELVLAPPQMMAAASDETVFSDYFPWLQTCEPLKIESRHFGLLLPQEGPYAPVSALSRSPVKPFLSLDFGRWQKSIRDSDVWQTSQTAHPITEYSSGKGSATQVVLPLFLRLRW